MQRIKQGEYYETVNGRKAYCIAAGILPIGDGDSMRAVLIVYRNGGNVVEPAETIVTFDDNWANWIRGPWDPEADTRRGLQLMLDQKRSMSDIADYLRGR